MSNNINKSQVFNQISELQKSLESIDKFLFKIQCVTDSQSFVEQEDGEPITLDYLPDVAMEKIKAITKNRIFSTTPDLLRGCIRF